MESPPALELRDVSKRYGELAALDHVSFAVRKGEAVGYLGPNGAGKSTTLKILSGLTVPSSGSALLQGRDPRGSRRSVLASVGILVETPGILPYLTGADLLSYIADVKGLPTGERARSVRAAAEAMGVGSVTERPLGALSTGLLRRLQLAGALIGDPAVLILDEPTMGLDPAARADLRGVLRGLVRGGRTLLLSTHLLEDVEEICHRVIFLRQGRVVGDEAVAPDVGAGGIDRPRTLRVTLVGPASVAALQQVLGETARVEEDGPQRFRLLFRGGLELQSEIIRKLASAGLSVASAEQVGTDLAARYLAKVGREDAP